MNSSAVVSRIVPSEPQELEANRLLSPIEQRALKLLGSGQNQKVVASVLGISESRISQLMAQDWFAAKVADLRYSQATQARDIDARYDNMEEKLQVKLERQIPLMFKSQEILKAIQIVNAARRKLGTAGQSSQELEGSSNVVSLTIPTQIINKFTVNINNQVVEVDGQSLVTATPQMLSPQASSKTQGESNEPRESTTRALPAPTEPAYFEPEILDQRRAICAEDLI